jgi:HAD superfamily hydrolase (TIGR01509 family)
VGVVTSNSAQRTGDWLRVAGLAHLVDFIVSGDEVKQGKPHPEPYALAAAKAGCAPADIVAVEDSPQGAASAVAAGLTTVALTQATAGLTWPSAVVPIASLAALTNCLWQ